MSTDIFKWYISNCNTTCFTSTVAGLRNECPVGMSFLNLLREDWQSVSDTMVALMKKKTIFLETGRWKQYRGESCSRTCGCQYHKAFDCWNPSRLFDWDFRSKYWEIEGFLWCHNHNSCSKSVAFVCICSWIWSSGTGELLYAVNAKVYIGVLFNWFLIISLPLWPCQKWGKRLCCLLSNTTKVHFHFTQ